MKIVKMPSADFFQKNPMKLTKELTVDRVLATNDAWSMYSDILSEHPLLRAFAKKVGGTPFIRVPSPNPNVEIFAKCEWMNGCGSIKDRTALILILDYLIKTRNDSALPKTILEYSGGNLGICLAYLCHRLSIPLHLVLSSGTPECIQKDLIALGVSLTLVDKELGFVAVIRKAEELARSQDYYFLYQHENDLNWKFHELTTGSEILAQSPGTINHWIASIGTGGTFSGVLRVLKAANFDVKATVVTPSELPYGSINRPNGLPKYAGSGGLGFGIRQRFVSALDAEITEHATVSYPDALKAAAIFYRCTNIRIGSSSAANYKIAYETAVKTDTGIIATIFPCRGNKMEWEKILDLTI